jgi:hypothetical protein
MPERIADPPQIQTTKLVRGLLASGAVALFCSAISAWCTVAGIVDIQAARLILAFAWTIGMAGTVASEFLWGKPLKRKLPINIAVGIVLAVGLYMLDNYGVKFRARNDAAKPFSEPSSKNFPTAAEIVDELEKRRGKEPASVWANPTSTKQEKPQAETQPITIEIENSGLLSDSRDWGVGFWIAYRSSHGDTISPINLALFLRFVNFRPTPVRIDSFTVEMQSGNTWIPLIQIRSLGQVIYGAYPTADKPDIAAALGHARRLDFADYGLESLLSKTDALLQPSGGMVRGWAFYGYPPSLMHVSGNEPIRITVRDMSGGVSQHIHYRIEERTNSNRALGQYIKVPPGGFEDISTVYRKHWDDP